MEEKIDFIKSTVIEETVDELSVLTKISHPNFPRIVEAFEEDADMRSLAVIIVQECFENENNDISVPDIITDRSIEYALTKDNSEESFPSPN